CCSTSFSSERSPSRSASGTYACTSPARYRALSCATCSRDSATRETAALNVFMIPTPVWSGSGRIRTFARWKPSGNADDAAGISGISFGNRELNLSCGFFSLPSDVFHSRQICGPAVIGFLSTATVAPNRKCDSSFLGWGRCAAGFIKAAQRWLQRIGVAAGITASIGMTAYAYKNWKAKTSLIVAAQAVDSRDDSALLMAADDVERAMEHVGT